MDKLAPLNQHRFTIQYQYRSCRKCKVCLESNVKPHGPYAYAYYYQGGRMYALYLNKENLLLAQGMLKQKRSPHA